ncbi:Clp protease N-terminal domain-containing protein [Actinospica sp. MGRD01-02]|uniref:Clp protease N-terminal domain-containing protein n=1 Tax=Actinospica acidithermotolerans TaxID=2828514 RepID=A0A941ECE5_9ACTN|nr:Clp protease N-terminal domain-containing protein [Actinospica acidithermotolerans]
MCDAPPVAAIFDTFTGSAKAVFIGARSSAQTLGQTQIAPEHLLMGLLARSPSDADVTGWASIDKPPGSIFVPCCPTAIRSARVTSHSPKRPRRSSPERRRRLATSVAVTSARPSCSSRSFRSRRSGRRSFSQSRA